MKKRNYHAGHRSRMRKRFQKGGFGNFADHEILEYMLFFLFKQKNTNVLAHQILDECGSFTGLFSGKNDFLKDIDGVGPRTVEFMNALGAFVKEIKRRSENKRVFDIGTDESQKYIKNLFKDHRREYLFAVVLDDKDNFIAHKKLSDGNAGHVSGDVSKIIQTVWTLNGTKVILAHNHPSGALYPSNADITVTERTLDTLNLVGIDLLEHMIVTKDGCVGIFDFIGKQISDE